jgi:hypothetical protein
MDQQASALDALLTSVTSVNDAAIKQAAKKQKLETPELVNKALQIRSDLRTVCLSKDAKNQIQVQALRILTERNPFWQHMLDVRVVTTYDLQGQPIANHINMRCRPEFTTLLHHEYAPNIMICFMASEQLEPLMIVIVLHKDTGKLINLGLEQIEYLKTAIDQFKTKYGLSGESYAYTTFQHRNALKQHSRHFHLKIRIPTAMYLKYFPMLQTLGTTRDAIQKLQNDLEPLAYKFTRQPTGTWEQVKELMLADTYQTILDSL